MSGILNIIVLLIKKTSCKDSIDIMTLQCHNAKEKKIYNILLFTKILLALKLKVTC